MVPSKLLWPSGEWREYLGLRAGELFLSYVTTLPERGYYSSYQILAFVLLYPSIEAFWNHVIYPAVRRSDRSSNESGDSEAAIAEAELGGGEKYGHEQEISLPRSKGKSHPLYRVVLSESVASFPSTLAGSSLSVSVGREVAVSDNL